MITFICCTNNKDELNSMLKPSLDLLKGKVPFNFYELDNGYKSAAEAYNDCLSKNWDCIGDTVIFLHQDIAFDSIDIFQKFDSELQNDPMQILGVAGINANSGTLSNLKYRDNGSYITKTQINKKTEVLSVDECLFATSKNLLSKIKFDTTTCFHWHLYAVDLCYAAKELNVKSYVMPHSIYHKHNNGSGLVVDYYFLKSMWRVAGKYRGKYEYIHTPCYRCPTSLFKCMMRLGRSFVKIIVS